MPGYVGFANLPNQIHRKSVKRGFEFTLMVVGELSATVWYVCILTVISPNYVPRLVKGRISQRCQIQLFLSVYPAIWYMLVYCVTLASQPGKGSEMRG